MAGKLLITVGAYVGFMNPGFGNYGRILLVRRTRTDSIISGQSFRGNWELPGGAVEDVEDPSAIDYNYVVQTAFAKAKEKVGIVISPLPQCGPFYSTFFKKENMNDLAVAIPCLTAEEPTVGETIWVSPAELDVLAGMFISETDAQKKGLAEAEGLLGGKGKRMWRMAMSILAHHSPNPLFKEEAQSLLRANEA